MADLPGAGAQSEPTIAHARRAERPVTTAAHVRRAARQGLAGVYPSRYRRAWREPMDARLGELLRPGATVLDVGSGAAPFIAPADRPEESRYVGLDISADELARAAPGSYDETVVADAATLVPELEGRFDVIVSWLVLEHVDGVPAALALLRRYLRPGGTLLAQLAGGGWIAGRLNRLVPHRVAVPLLAALMGRASDDVFPAHYDHCTHGALVRALAAEPWAAADVRPLFAGAAYFGFAPPLLAAVLAFEEWAYRTGRRDLAAYYLIEARR